MAAKECESVPVGMADDVASLVRRPAVDQMRAMVDRLDAAIAVIDRRT